MTDPSEKFKIYGALYDRFERACRDVSQEISDEDENVQNDSKDKLQQYLFGGRSALKLCIDSLAQANAKPPRRILDFPCGHGRVLRFFKEAFPEAELFASDLNETGLEYCKAKFGAQTFASHVDINAIELPKDIDLIWCGSLLTHFSAERTKLMISKMLDSLAPDGLCLFTTHGRMYPRFIAGVHKMINTELWDSIQRDYYRTGFGYKAYPTPRWTEAQYGISMTSPGWIFDFLHERDDVTVLRYSEKGWHGQQDVTVVQRRALQAWYDFNHL